jgi:uncharacterized protein YciI
MLLALHSYSLMHLCLHLIARYVPDILEKRCPHREPHLAGANKKMDAGQLVMAGAGRAAAAAA